MCDVMLLHICDALVLVLLAPGLESFLVPARRIKVLGVTCICDALVLV